ncbi:MAG: ribonucleoside triphosphate reductase, partial [Treponema sp.]|nr:ribonucleoside triphosphate reductase [Treponema sp.]
MREQSVFPQWRSFLGTGSENEPVMFIRHVVKRSGEVEDYNRFKIFNAILKATEAVGQHPDPDKAEKLTGAVEERLKTLMVGRHSNSIPAIEEIQDIVETILIENLEVQIAKAYILYRAQHEAIRDAKKLMLDINKTMDGYLSRADWRVNENANVN